MLHDPLIVHDGNTVDTGSHRLKYECGFNTQAANAINRTAGTLPKMPQTLSMLDDLTSSRPQQMRSDNLSLYFTVVQRVLLWGTTTQELLSSASSAANVTFAAPL